MPESPPDLLSLIGQRVRTRRQERGWTLDELAERSGVSRRMLINVEQGASNASIGTMLRLAEALGVGLPALVAPATDGRAPRVTRRGTRPALWTGAHGGRAILVADATEPDALELWDWTLGPGDAHASEPHVAGTWELLTVLEGEVIVSVGGDDVVLATDDAVSFPGDVVHAYRNDGPAQARFALTVFEPAPGRSGR